MKCRKCGREMKRQKTQERTFIYVCPVCHKVIKGSNDPTPENEYKDAYEIIMGQKE